MLFQYYMNNGKSKSSDFIISEEHMKNVVKKISDIDPYSNTYLWDKFRITDIFKKIKFPLNIKFPEFKSNEHC